jgi:hypothetical protein
MLPLAVSLFHYWACEPIPLFGLWAYSTIIFGLWAYSTIWPVSTFHYLACEPIPLFDRWAYSACEPIRPVSLFHYWACEPIPLFGLWAYSTSRPVSLFHYSTCEPIPACVALLRPLSLSVPVVRHDLNNDLWPLYEYVSLVSYLAYICFKLSKTLRWKAIT